MIFISIKSSVYITVYYILIYYWYILRPGAGIA
jgi:hypothetical protein